MRRDFAIVLVFTVVVTIAGTLAILALQQREATTSPEVVLDAVVAKMLADYHPGDVILTPDEYDAAMADIASRYFVAQQQLRDSMAVLDSLRLRIGRCEVRR